MMDGGEGEKGGDSWIVMRNEHEHSNNFLLQWKLTFLSSNLVFFCLAEDELFSKVSL